MENRNHAPFGRIRPGGLRRVAVPVLIVYAPAWLPFLLVGDPQEMVRLQLAGSEAAARLIVSGWSQAETVDMSFLVGVDHVHLLAYSVLLALGAVWAGRQFRGAAARWAPVAGWMAFGAALFDILENVGLIVMIRGEIDAPAPAMTRAVSFAKYSLALAVGLYVAAGFVARLRRPSSEAGPRSDAAV